MAAFNGVWHIPVFDIFLSSSLCLARDILLICVHHYLLSLRLFVGTLRCGTAMYLEYQRLFSSLLVSVFKILFAHAMGS